MTGLVVLRKNKKMTTTGYWQHTMLLQCSLQVVRYEFLHLCLDLVRFYAPFERHIYYEEDPAIGEHFYLAAVKQQRREREEAQLKRRRTEGSAEHQVRTRVTGPPILLCLTVFFFFHSICLHFWSCQRKLISVHAYGIPDTTLFGK